MGRARSSFAQPSPVQMVLIMQRKMGEVSVGLILLIILVLLLVGALPTWGYSRGWGYYPSGGLGLVLVIVLILFLLGRV